MPLNFILAIALTSLRFSEMQIVDVEENRSAGGLQTNGTCRLKMAHPCGRSTQDSLRSDTMCPTGQKNR
jgi:hypothetical protein